MAVGIKKSSVGTDRWPEVADAWLTRLETLESALLSAGRRDIVTSLIDRMRTVTLTLRQSGGPERVELLKSAFCEVKRCVASEHGDPDPTLLARLDQVEGSAPDRPQGLSAAPQQLSPPPPAPEPEPVSDDLLGAFADADGDDVEALFAGLDEPPAEEPNHAAPSPIRDALGTLREPLPRTRDSAAAAAGDTKVAGESRVLMKGELHPGLISDLIQLFAQNSETGRIRVQGQDRTGEIYFDDGTIIDANCGDQVGEAGFYQVMQITAGRFTYERGSLASEVRIKRSAQHLIMETLRLMDESGA